MHFKISKCFSCKSSCAAINKSIFALNTLCLSNNAGISKKSKNNFQLIISVPYSEETKFDNLIGFNILSNSILLQ